jgi:hypothetical protein
VFDSLFANRGITSVLKTLKWLKFHPCAGSDMPLIYLFQEAARAGDPVMRHNPMISTERKPAPITIGFYSRCRFPVTFS